MATVKVEAQTLTEIKQMIKWFNGRFHHCTRADKLKFFNAITK